MFHSIPEPVRRRMAYLEERDAQDRVDGTPHQQRLRQIPPETGRFIALLAAGAPEGEVLEVGTSAGYSSLWLGLACQERGVHLVTFEWSPAKVELARATLAAAGLESVVQIVAGDARDFLPRFGRVGFCFLDAEKEIYPACYDLVVPNLVPGGWLVADNFLSHAQELRTLRDTALADRRVDATVVPVGKGLLLCRKVPERA